MPFQMVLFDDEEISPRLRSHNCDSGLEVDDETFELDGLTVDLDRLSELNSTQNLKNSKSRRRRKKRNSGSLTQPTFNDIYRLTGEGLGQGSYGSVKTCINRSTGMEHAVKMIQTKSRTRVFNEIEILHKCASHPHIVQLVEYFEEDEMFYLVFEKMNGGPLLDHIERRGHFSEVEAIQVVREIATALSFLHEQGIAHRDLKPANILCQDSHSVSPIKICDFDLSKTAPAGEDCGRRTPELLSPVGSAEYMAPEVVRLFAGNASTYDKRCDLWSLGVILYIMLCGFPPFEGRCGNDSCLWELGENCNTCQNSLMRAIEKCSVSFKDPSWDDISDDAKDLVMHLLERDANSRFVAREVLAHRWLSPLTSDDRPATDIYQRQFSAKDMSEVADNLVVWNRVISQRRILNGDQRPRNDTIDSGFDGSHEMQLASVETNNYSEGYSLNGPVFD